MSQTRATDDDFRAEVRQFLAAELTVDLRLAGRRASGVFADYPAGHRWFRILAARGWSVPHWPIEWGGCGWSARQHDIFASELAAADAPALAPQGPRMVGPVVLAFGTPEQQQRWLPGIRSGEDYWAQGYSEPGSGSDLASLQCRAQRQAGPLGDEFVINGTKIWTTHAQWANKIFCLVRTDSTGRPQQGISFLLFDLALPGITIRPIISISGDHELNQVFFDEVRVPASALLGEENRGWTIAKYLLTHERGGSYTPMLRARLARLHSARAAAYGPAISTPISVKNCLSSVPSSLPTDGAVGSSWPRMRAASTCCSSACSASMRQRASASRRPRSVYSGSSANRPTGRPANAAALALCKRTRRARSIGV